MALLLQDDSGALICKWFQTRSTYLQERFPVGTRVVGSGMVTLNGTPERGKWSTLTSKPLMRMTPSRHFGRVVPIYPLTAGLHQKAMRALMKMVIDTYVPQETLPEALRRAHHLPVWRRPCGRCISQTTTQTCCASIVNRPPSTSA